MIRPMFGLAVACFLVGCGSSSAPDAGTTADSAKDGSTATATEGTTSTHTVLFKVPGMT